MRLIPDLRIHKNIFFFLLLHAFIVDTPIPVSTLPQFTPRHSKPSRNSIVDLNEQQPVCVHDDVVSDTIAVHYNIIEYVGQDLMWLRHR